MAQFLEFFGNHSALFIALGVVLTLLVANEVHGALTGGKRLNAPEAVRLINDRDPLVLDVRTPADFKRGHLLHAQNTPLAKLDEHLVMIGKDKARPILIYCALGGSATAAADKLKKLGHTEVYPLRGGINAWLTANLPVTTK